MELGGCHPPKSVGEDTRTEQYLHDICLCDRGTGEVFYADLGFIYLELVNFTKEESDLQDDLESWLFVLKNTCRQAGEQVGQDSNISA